MNNSTSNRLFLATVHPDTKKSILKNMAEHYGIAPTNMEHELTTGVAEGQCEPEDIMEYVTVDRAAVHFLYKAFKSIGENNFL